MSKQEMTITRALAELKLLDKRINKLTTGAAFVSFKKKISDKTASQNLVKDFEMDAKSTLDSIEDLIKRHDIIKSAIVLSNATNNITIAGRQYTVAGAIERKNSIAYEQNLLKTLTLQYKQSLVSVDTKNSQVQNSLNVLLENMSSKENSKNLNEETTLVSKAYLENNEYEIVDPLEASSLIAKMEKDIDEFLFEVDFSLSESNSKNTIEI